MRSIHGIVKLYQAAYSFFSIQKFATEIILLIIKNINNTLLLSTLHTWLFDWNGIF